MKLFFIILGLFFLIVTIIVSYIFGIKPKGKAECCTEKTTGIVIGPSIYTYNDDIRMPSVEYFVNGQRYKVAGPRFKYVLTKNISTPFHNPITQFECNLNARDDLPDHLEIYSSGNSFTRISESPVMKLFPAGTKVNVYYNPNKPKESYVIRYYPPSPWTRYLLYAITAFVLIVNILIWISLA